MEKGSRPVRKISRSYQLVLRYDIMCEPLTDAEIRIALTEYAANKPGRGLTGVGVRQTERNK